MGTVGAAMPFLFNDLGLDAYICRLRHWYARVAKEPLEKKKNTRGGRQQNTVDVGYRKEILKSSP